jgi:hypothetical protein
MERTEYLGQPNCQRLANDSVEVVITTDIGPRIIRYALVGGDNILGEVPDAAVETELGTWKPWGGHRLWTAPEALPRSYVPDNGPIECQELGERAVRLIQPVEAPTGIQKQMSVSLDAEGSRVVIHHKITNTNLWAVTLAPWALTILAGGGRTIIPQEPYISHDDCLLPARPLVLWHYTDLSDPRWSIGPKYIQLRTDEAMEEPQKAGVANAQGWAAYLRQRTLFVKTVPCDPDAAYPDCGCNCETFTKADFMELETVGALATLEPGESAEHVEEWHLFDGVQAGDSEEELDAALSLLLAEIRGAD